VTALPAVTPRPQFAWPASTAVARWSTFGPYYAMFPVSFVRATVETLCPPGGAVLDPFCGRGTVPYVARITGRPSVGIDINSVAYLFSATKADPEPRMERIIALVGKIADAIRPDDMIAANEFQRLAWSPRVLGFLNAARRVLDWRGKRLDRTVMALLLVHLHGKTGNAVSNQMRQSKSMAPDYAVRWWTARGLTPPDLDPARYFTDRAVWRYSYGVPTGAKARIELGDARGVLPRVRRRFSLLLTSPPYRGVTNYRLDNWIRLWMLGEGELPDYATAQRHRDRKRYAEMLRGVFSAAKRILEEDAVIYVRTDRRLFTQLTTQSLLAELWPSHGQFARCERPRQSQTMLFGHKSEKPGETDFLLLPPGRGAPPGFAPAASIMGVEPDRPVAGCGRVT
jgi:hypothetical protein